MSGIVGFIGLGQMGSRMARNLMSAGTKLVVCDINGEKSKSFVSATIVKYPSEVAAMSNKIITMLPESKDVEDAYIGKSGILETLRSGSLCIDCSTIDQPTTVKLEQLVCSKGSSFLDAPVSGGILGAENATLTFMVGGSAAAFEQAKSLLKLMGKTSVHCGKVGSGQAVKACNNTLLAITMIGLAEVAHLGSKLGLDPKVLMSVINTSSGRCWASDTYNPVPDVMSGTPASKNYEGGFSCALMSKDLGLTQNSSTGLKVPTPMSSLANSIYLLLAQSPEHRQKDFTIIYKFLEDKML